MRLMERIAARRQNRPLAKVGSAAGAIESAAIPAEEILNDLAVILDDWRADGKIEIEIRLGGLGVPLRITIPIPKDV